MIRVGTAPLDPTGQSTFIYDPRKHQFGTLAQWLGEIVPLGYGRLAWGCSARERVTRSTVPGCLAETEAIISICYTAWDIQQ